MPSKKEIGHAKHRQYLLGLIQGEIERPKWGHVVNLLIYSYIADYQKFFIPATHAQSKLKTHHHRLPSILPSSASIADTMACN